METIEATFRIVTPMFIGGANQTPNDGIRPPSVKGALRFWWRALNWKRMCANNASEANALNKLHQMESNLFGAATSGSKPKQGQALFLLKIKSFKKASLNEAFSGAGVGYLKGQGLGNREAISLGAEFIVQLVLKPSLVEQQELKEGLIEALLAFGLFGGLGSKTRSGFGSVSIQALTVNEKPHQIPADKKSYIEFYKNLLENTPDILPPYSAFFRNSRIDVSDKNIGGNAERILDRVGNVQMGFREELGRKSDSKLVGDIAHGAIPKKLPQRAIFGLPHNYYFRGGTKVDIFPASSFDDNTPGRRASPLFVHVHQFASGKFLLVHILLESKFLPNDRKIFFKVGGGSNRHISFKNNLISWDVLNDYLNEFRETIK